MDIYVYFSLCMTLYKTGEEENGYITLLRENCVLFRSSYTKLFSIKKNETFRRNKWIFVNFYYLLLVIYLRVQFALFFSCTISFHLFAVCLRIHECSMCAMSGVFSSSSMYYYYYYYYLYLCFSAHILLSITLKGAVLFVFSFGERSRAEFFVLFRLANSKKVIVFHFHKEYWPFFYIDFFLFSKKINKSRSITM